MSGAELTPDYLNAYSGRQSRTFMTRVLKKMALMEKRSKYAEALDYCETQILYCSDVYGEASPQAWTLCERFAATSNALAVAAVQQGSYHQPTQLLRRTLALLRRCSTRSDPRHLLVQVVTLNNLGTHYRRTDRLRASLSCLTKAVSFNGQIEDMSQQADSHVNICATLSALEKHLDAAEHAAQAIALLRIETVEMESKMNEDETLNAEWQQRSGVMAVTMYNHGVELEHLMLDQAGIKAFKEAARVCNRCFGPGHPTTAAMEQNYESALASMVEEHSEHLAETLNMLPGASSDRSIISPSERSFHTVHEDSEFVFEDEDASVLGDEDDQNAGSDSDDDEDRGGSAEYGDELSELLSLMPQYDNGREWPAVATSPENREPLC